MVGGSTTTLKLYVALKLGVPLSETRTLTVFVAGDCNTVGRHVSTPELVFRLTPAGAPTEDTAVQEVCDFAGRAYLQKDLGTFRGDRAFLGNDAAQKAFSKLRSAIGGLYAWRAAHAESSEEKSRMQKEADFAFRQALALCPCSPEAVFRYVQSLLSENRRKEALLVAQTCQRIDPANAQVTGLVEHLSKLP